MVDMGPIVGVVFGALLAIAGVAVGAWLAWGSQSHLARRLGEYDRALAEQRAEMERLYTMVDDIDAEDIGL